MSREIRITLSHEIEGSLVISSPGGWEGAIFGLERNDYSSLTEYYKSGHSLYGTNGSENGGRDWAKNIEQVYGPDAIVQALIEIAEEDEPFETLFTGQLPIETAIEVLEFDHTLQMTFDPVSFWTTFKSRLDTPVQIFSAEDLDGGAVVPLVPFDITMLSQIIQARFSASKDRSTVLVSYNYGVVKYAAIGWDKIVLDEIQETPNPYASYDIVIPITVKTIYKSQLTTINFKIYACNIDATIAGGGGGTITFNNYVPVTSHYKLCLLVNDLIVETIAQTDFSDYSVYELSTTITNDKGDKITIAFITDTDGTVDAGRLIILGSDVSTVPEDIVNSYFDLTLTNPPIPEPSDVADDNFITIEVSTEFEQTLSPALLIHDIAASIVQRITGVANSFKSEFLGRTNTLARAYAANGCGSPYINIKGLQLRGYTLEEKPPSMSMKQFWDCWNPILNLGMGFKMLAGIPTIIIEDKSKFYDASNVSVQLSNVRNIKKSWDESLIYKKAEFGYSNGQGQITSGLDDPQTKRTWATALKNIGTVLSMMSTGIAASLTIEQARRTTKQLSADYQYDNDDFIIKVVEDGATFKPETTEGYNSVTNLLNWETRYNKDITPTRNLIRWLNVACIGLQWVLSSFFKFVSGEGNYDMVVNKDDGCLGDYSNEDLSEKQNVQVVSDILHLPILYDIQHDLTYEQLKAIKANPEWAIEISQTESNYVKFFIKVLEWKQSNGDLKLSAYPIEYFNIQNIDTDVTEYETPNPPRGRVFDKSFDKPFN